MAQIMDFAADYSEGAPAFFAAGVVGVMRYVAKSGARQGKAITAAEAKRWLAAGVSIGLVYQDRGGSGGHIADFSETIAAQQAARAIAVAKEIGLPSGCAIYNAVDNDFGKSDLPTLVAHFQAFSAPIRAAGYRVGGYGSGLVTAALLKAGAIDLVWLGGAYGWQGSRVAKDAGLYDLLQAPQKRTTIGGKTIDYDPNFPKVEGHDYGQWVPGAAAKPRTPPPLQTPVDRTVRHGDKGQDVSRYQRILNLRVDGDYGDLTEAAVLGFQLGAGLATDGVVGPATRAALIAKEK